VVVVGVMAMVMVVHGMCTFPHATAFNIARTGLFLAATPNLFCKRPCTSDCFKH